MIRDQKRQKTNLLTKIMEKKLNLRFGFGLDQIYDYLVNLILSYLGILAGGQTFSNSSSQNSYILSASLRLLNHLNLGSQPSSDSSKA